MNDCNYCYSAAVQTKHTESGVRRIVDAVWKKHIREDCTLYGDPGTQQNQPRNRHFEIAVNR